MLVRCIALFAIACAPDISGQVNGLVDPAGTPGDTWVVVPGNEGPEVPSIVASGLTGIPLGEDDTGEAVEGPELLADSVADFSAVQGRSGWTYGYLEPEGANTFIEMVNYVEGGADPGWYAALGGVYWTMMDASTMHPNGVVTTGGRQPVEQWAVRRWVSEEAGEIEVKGHFAKLSVDGESNGVAAYVFVDGVMTWAWYLEGWDDTGIDYDKVLTVGAGSTVDFVLDPWQADDRSDRSTFAGQVWSVPPA